VPTLVQAARDRVAFVRRGAVIALGTVGVATPEVLEALIHSLVDVDAAVIDNAAHSLLSLGPPAIGPLTSSLKDTDVGLRQMAVLTLSGGIRFGKLRPIPPETVTALIETLGDSSADIRDEAARALADLGPQAKGALPALRQMATSDPAAAVRLVARRAIEQIESRP
jgi:HEAT repeat protein